MYTFNCKYCGKEKSRAYKDQRDNLSFCDRSCTGKFNNKQITKECSWCGKPVTRTQGELNHKKRTSKRVYCNTSCAASFNNTQKRKSRRSKCEKLLFDLLKLEFPHLDLLPNDKNMLNGYEVDIAIPSLKIAIEWNGIVHFQPIYGKEKLTNIQMRDKEKSELAAEKGINLIVIPDLVSTKTYVKETFLKIKQFIVVLLGCEGNDPSSSG